jgi:predicted metalloprotease with PDZ domain
MGYGTQPYDRFLTGLVARDPSGQPIELIDLEGPRWSVRSAADRPLATVSYQVDLDRMDRTILNAGDASRARPEFLGLLGYSVFGFLEGLQDEPIELTIRFPAGWPVVTTLAPLADSIGAVTVRAPSYHALADAQVMGGRALVTRRVGSAVPLLVAAYSEGPFDPATVTALADTALRRAAAWFGSTPFPHFTVSIEILRPVSTQHSYQFSMEHLESATIRMAAGTLDLGATGRNRFEYNLAHHIAHAWIPKRCAPAGYYPFVWDYAAPIEMIWFSEGWAQFAAADMMALGAADPDAVRRRFAARRFDEAAVDSQPPIAGLSTAAMSAIAAHQYSEDFRMAQAVFARGGLMAEAIDRRIRERSGGDRSFRDLGRALMRWCATAGVPVSVDSLVAVARRETGTEVRDLIDRWLASRGAPPPGRPRP